MGGGRPFSRGEVVGVVMIIRGKQIIVARWSRRTHAQRTVVSKSWTAQDSYTAAKQIRATPFRLRSTVRTLTDQNSRRVSTYVASFFFSVGHQDYPVRMPKKKATQNPDFTDQTSHQLKEEIYDRYHERTKHRTSRTTMTFSGEYTRSRDDPLDEISVPHGEFLDENPRHLETSLSEIPGISKDKFLDEKCRDLTA